MSYALFAQRKVELTGYLNCLQLQQTQRSDEQQALATDTLSLQQQMSSLQVSQSNELALEYQNLANVGTSGAPEYGKTYTKKANGASGTITIPAVGADGAEAAFKEAQTDFENYCKEERNKIDSKIKTLEAQHKREIDAINRKVYLTSVKENTVEMAVKRLDTAVTTVQKQLEAIQEAEGKGIESATPQFKGIG